ncbi:LysR family transcriptional regulator [Prauserella flavalba]|nr:LysR family transcriptional regulator [Prauserella flavalba]
MLHLRYFVAVAEELNFTRAAQRLHMAVSPLSRRVKDLERELGAALFVRGHHRVELTGAGEALLPAARDVIQRFDAVPELVRAHGEPRTAVVGIASDVTTGLRTRFLGAVADRFPGLEVRLRPASTEPLVHAVRHGEIELALVHGPVAGRGLRTAQLETHPVAVVTGAGTGFDGRESVRLEELAHLPFASIGYDAAPEIYRRTDELLSGFGVRKRMVVEGHNFGGLAHVVATGQAFTLIGVEAGITSRAFAGEPVVVLPVEGVKLRITTVAVWRADRAEPPGVVADLVAVVHELVGQ